MYHTWIWNTFSFPECLLCQVEWRDYLILLTRVEYRTRFRTSPRKVGSDRWNSAEDRCAECELVQKCAKAGDGRPVTGSGRENGVPLRPFYFRPEKCSRRVVHPELMRLVSERENPRCTNVEWRERVGSRRPHRHRRKGPYIRIFTSRIIATNIIHHAVECEASCLTCSIIVQVGQWTALVGAVRSASSCIQQLFEGERFIYTLEAMLTQWPGSKVVDQTDDLFRVVINIPFKSKNSSGRCAD